MSGECETALRRCRSAVVTAFGLSAILNLLTLAGSLYMMVVYDLVIPSRNGASLAALLALLTAAYAAQGYADELRGRVIRLGFDMFSVDLTGRISAVSRRMAFEGAPREDDPGRPMALLRTFATGPAVTSVMDAPWSLLFVAVLFLLHPWLGVVTVLGAALLIVIAWRTRAIVSAPSVRLERSGVLRMVDSEARRLSARTARALGMEDRIDARTTSIGEEADTLQEDLAVRTARMSGIARTIRMLLQSVVLTVGALLVINDKATGGIIFASSILSGRALAPIDQIIANWRIIGGARSAWDRLRERLEAFPLVDARHRLPAPVSDLTVTHVGVAIGDRPVIRDVTFGLKAGEAMAIVGSSGSGKTTLAAALVGAIPGRTGEIRLDGADLDQWASEELGRHVGWLPQDVQLLRGTVASNIARLDPAAPPEAVIAAARAAGVHEFILSLAKGYDTPLGDGGMGLSAGQRQRIGLARALYGDPFLVVLDEPNSNLDAEGEAALSAAIAGAKARGAVVVIAAHRPAVLTCVTHVLVLRDGKAVAFGPRDKVLRPRMADGREMAA